MIGKKPIHDSIIKSCFLEVFACFHRSADWSFRYRASERLTYLMYFLVNELQTPPSLSPIKKSYSDYFIQIVEKRSKTNEKRKISDFLSSSYCENSSKIDQILNTKMAITRKIKIGISEI